MNLKSKISEKVRKSITSKTYQWHCKLIFSKLWGPPRSYPIGLQLLEKLRSFTSNHTSTGFDYWTQHVYSSGRLVPTCRYLFDPPCILQPLLTSPGYPKKRESVGSRSNRHRPSGKCSLFYDLLQLFYNLQTLEPSWNAKFMGEQIVIGVDRTRTYSVNGQSLNHWAICSLHFPYFLREDQSFLSTRSKSGCSILSFIV